ncbi:phosphatidylserine decarboxylase [Echinicola jeungdonensis]|uniref:phosphatidylserine decarboxylase n=1 Tax=Echinicola jeungdonensis TaxID=709343 RepID=UPI0025B5FC5F|nr:phosphatidylserine decarboxylase [Echinicola jeungdonensis]MDN3671399.1 phosphatidylserine decarboxylase [Echinicola jeungdonensis]
MRNTIKWPWRILLLGCIKVGMKIPNWKTFNQFFARHLKSPDQRPIASPDDPSVVAAFADSRPQGVWDIDGNSEIISKEGVPVKSARVQSIPELLGKESAYKNAFAKGTFTHSFLGISDYHRFHFPMSGTIKEIRVIPGVNPSGVNFGGMPK